MSVAADFVTPAKAGVEAPVGLSSRTSELWLAALRHRRIADALAAAAAARKQA